MADYRQGSHTVYDIKYQVSLTDVFPVFVNMIRFRRYERMDTALIIKLAILISAAILLGYKLGQKSWQYTYGGEIVFETLPDGDERCVFKLESDDDWLSQQECVLFKIEHDKSGLQL